MKSRLHKIEITNFKAFRQFSLDLDGRHLLVYGDNGAGKSSLYWALYTFLQSARKPTTGVEKYFTPGGSQTLLNIHEQGEAAPRPGRIALTFRDTATNKDSAFTISKDEHETKKKPLIEKGDLASDFITYRFFFGFSDFKNSKDFNLWPLFRDEILPFCVSTTTVPETPLDWWRRIESGNANPSKNKGPAATKSYSRFQLNTDNFALVLDAIVQLISDKAQDFYDQHFSSDDPAKITLKLVVPKDNATKKPVTPAYNRATKTFTPPEILFGLKVGNTPISRPQSFLNEAKLTQLALSVRFAASMVNLHESDLKLLVLDDLLVSLDMSNRMKIVDILLSETFDNYQKIILTHDLGFFREFRRSIGSNHPNWAFVRLIGDPKTNICYRVEKTELEKAEDYLNGHCLDEAAVCLRKAAEDMAKRFREWYEKKKLPPGEFFTLTENLRAARNKLFEKLPMSLYNRVLYGTPAAYRENLLPANDADVDTITGIAAADCGKLKSQRKNLRLLFKDENWKVMENIKLIDEVLNTTERILNPGAHGGHTPLYEHEVNKAIELISKLEKCLA